MAGVSRSLFVPYSIKAINKKEMALDCPKLHDKWIYQDVGHSFSMWRSLPLHAVGPLDVEYRNTKDPASNVNVAISSFFPHQKLLFRLSGFLVDSFHAPLDTP